jgi:hypothetical protein
MMKTISAAIILSLVSTATLASQRPDHDVLITQDKVYANATKNCPSSQALRNKLFANLHHVMDKKVFDLGMSPWKMTSISFTKEIMYPVPIINLPIFYDTHNKDNLCIAQFVDTSGNPALVIKLEKE